MESTVRKLDIFGVLLLITLIFTTGCESNGAQQPDITETATKKTTSTKASVKTDAKAEIRVDRTAPTLDVPDGLYAEFKTSRGTILVQLEYTKVPLTVTNFVALALGHLGNRGGGEPFYNGLKFHRVIPKFMIQGGCPNGTGRGNPGYKFRDEFHPDLRHDRPGILSMANSGPATNGSQFFITHVPTAWLDNKHSVFGHVVQGMDIVNAIKGGDKLIELNIHRIGAAAQAFKADRASFDRLRAGK
ncbi:peptidylprolyl isomerase [bacterium AH-315-F18]|nr:peptidylprolyl isomerase [bacterium AH-315-F18]